MVDDILPLMKSHQTYVEVFGGGGSILLAKDPSPVEVYNDINSNLVNFFRVLRMDEHFDEFYKLCVTTPFAKEEFLYFRENMNTEPDPVKRAWMFFALARFSFGGRHHKPSWGKVITASTRNMAATVSSWISSIDRLYEIHTRLFRVCIENMSWRDLIPAYDTEETLFYLDPPYVAATRKSGTYEHEMGDADHRELVAKLLGIKGKAILSGYPNDIYKVLEMDGWERRDYSATCTVAGRTRSSNLQGVGNASGPEMQRTESVWISPNCAGGVSGGFF